jgi:hypothetical protein
MLAARESRIVFADETVDADESTPLTNIVPHLSAGDDVVLMAWRKTGEAGSASTPAAAATSAAAAAPATAAAAAAAPAAATPAAAPATATATGHLDIAQELLGERLAQQPLGRRAFAEQAFPVEDVEGGQADVGDFLLVEAERNLGKRCGVTQLNVACRPGGRRGGTAGHRQ